MAIHISDDDKRQIEYLIIDCADYDENKNAWTIDDTQIDAVVTELSESNPDMDVLDILRIVNAVIRDMRDVTRLT